MAEVNFNKGLQAEAARELLLAIKQDPNDPALYYLLAYIQHNAGQVDAAERTVQRAVELEAAQPIRNWGQMMERYQGASRRWLEAARSAEPSA